MDASQITRLRDCRTDNTNLFVGGFVSTSTISVFNANRTSVPTLAGSFSNTGVSGFLMKMQTNGKFTYT